MTSSIIDSKAENKHCAGNGCKNNGTIALRIQYIRGQNNDMWIRTWSRTWSQGDTDLGIQLGVLPDRLYGSPPLASWDERDALYVFYCGENGHLWTIHWEFQVNGWAGHNDLGGTLYSSPTAAAPIPNVEYVFYTTTNDVLATIINH